MTTISHTVTGTNNVLAIAHQDCMEYITLDGSVVPKDGQWHVLKFPKDHE